jgi:hypothetical protein
MGYDAIGAAAAAQIALPGATASSTVSVALVMRCLLVRLTSKQRSGD